MRLTALTVAFLISFLSAHTQVVKVEVKKEADKWQMYRGGQPYFVKGGGGHVYLDKLLEIGGNSIRTWGAENAQEILDEAESKGITVMLGLWVQHERHGFDYDNKLAVRKQLEGFRKVVERFKDHPALLMWGVGNEVDLNYSNTNVWDAVQDIAKMIHEIDPNHPTSTVTAGLDAKEVELILEKAPDIDIYCVNTYGDIGKVKGNINKFGWNGPYMITEWGVNGHWESPNTEFGIPIEQTSKEKAASFTTRYTEHIAGDPEFCIGSYAFLWGQKQETTSTWYGLFTKDGESSEAVDAISRCWGNEPSNSAPTLESITLDGKKASENIYLTAQDVVSAQVAVTDKDGDRLSIRWAVRPESTDKKSGGDAEGQPSMVNCGLKKSGKTGAKFRVPKREGPYRLYVFVYDGKEHFAAANIPFYALPRPAQAEQARTVEFKTRTLDLPID
jgi:hypothetical protein